MLMTLDWTRMRDSRAGSRYPLPPLVIRAVLGVLSGCRTLRGLEAWSRTWHGELNTLLGTRWKTSPCWSGWRHVLNAIGEADFTAALAPAAPGAALHVDGKALRGSSKGQAAMQMLLSVFDGEAVVAMLPFGKGHEAARARQALATLQARGGLDGCWITFDAAHTQKNS